MLTISYVPICPKCHLARSCAPRAAPERSPASPRPPVSWDMPVNRWLGVGEVRSRPPGTESSARPNRPNALNQIGELEPARRRCRRRAAAVRPCPLPAARPAATIAPASPRPAAPAARSSGSGPLCPAAPARRPIYLIKILPCFSLPLNGQGWFLSRRRGRDAGGQGQAKGR